MIRRLTHTDLQAGLAANALQLVREEFALDKMGREYDAVLREFAARADDAPAL